MKILFLGTSAATSVPLVFCKCRVCENARINKGKDFRKRSSLMINDDLLIDFGPDVVTAVAMYDVDLTKVKYVLQTHGHSDHFDAGHIITRLKEYAAENVEHIRLVASVETVKSLDRWMKTEDPDVDLFDQKCLDRLHMDIQYIDHGDCIKLGEYSVTAIESLHDLRENSLIYVIQYNQKNILYGTDLLRISDRAWNILKTFQLDIVILDHTYGEGFNAGGHLDAGQVIDMIKKMKEEEIIDETSMVYATHISHEGTDTHDVLEKFAMRNGYRIAYDGLEINI
ncbi:MAG: MBL fold metallo-hydrolase [Clostridia bacterium]|jgi:phosphoribosyl 1,2-cyclic phosphate phosphodiesterase